MVGRYSVSAAQLFPGDAVIGGGGRYARLVFLRFRDLPDAESAGLADRLREAFAGQPGLRQIRLFRAEAVATVDHVATVEIAGPVLPWDVGRLGAAVEALDLVNTYVPYWRAEPRRLATGPR